MLLRTQAYQSAPSGDTHAGLFEDIGTRSLQNVRVGEGAGKIATGTSSVYIGYESGKQAATTSFSVYAGYQAGMFSSASKYATLIGAFSGRENAGSEVTFIGYRSGELNKGSQLVAIGTYSMRENVSGTASVAVGHRALERSLDGDYNCALGAESAQDMRSGSYTTAMGYRSARAAFKNNYGCYFGAFAGYSNSIGSGNCLFGFKSGYNINGDFNVGIGIETLYNAGDSSCNIAIGPFAGSSLQNTTGSVIIGKSASANSTQGAFSVIIGTDAGLSNNGDNNVLLGARVAQQGALNSSVVIGADAAPNIQGSASVIIGAGIAKSVQTGSSNVLLGAGADGYRPNVSSAIAIGTNKTFTSTNSISIGDDIVNERTSSILMGYSLKSDANNSVIMGNDINIQSVIYWKDPLNLALVETVRADALTKLGVSNIIYGTSNQPLVSPNGEVYNNAIVGLITSNIYNSVNAPRSLAISPTSYDLRTAISPSNYLLIQGRAYPIRTDTAATSTINIQSKVDTSVPSLASTLSNQTAISLSNYVSRHTLNTTIHIPPTSNVVTNIVNFNATSTTVSVSFPKTAAVPHSPTLASNVQYTSVILAPAATPTPITINPPALVMSPTGLHNIPNSTTKYSVITPPIYGTLNAARFTSNLTAPINATAPTTPTLQYTPFIQSTFASQDSFTLRPVLEIVDRNSNIFGCPSSNDITITVNLAPPQQTLYAENLISVDQAPVAITSNLLRAVPTPIDPTTPIRILDISDNAVVTTTPPSTPTTPPVTYTSNMIATMTAEEVHLYPDSQYAAYITAAQASVNTVVASNVQQFHNTFDSIFTTQIPSYVVSLSNYLAQTLSNLVPDPLDNTLSNYEPIPDTTPILADLMTIAELAPPVPDSAITYAAYSNAFRTWTASHDPTLQYPETQNISASNTFYEARRTYDEAIEEYATFFEPSPDHLQPSLTSSNLLRSAIDTVLSKTAPYATYTPPFQTYNDLLATTTQTATLLHKYYEIPRLFLTYQDLIANRLTVTPAASPAHITILPSPTAPSPLTYTITTVQDRVWSSFPLAFPDVTIPRTKQLPSRQSFIAPPNTSNLYVDTYPQHGHLSDGSNYDLINPWMTQDTVRIVAQHDDGIQLADASWTLRYNADIAYEPSLTIPCPPTTSTITSNYITLSNIEMTSVSLCNITYTFQSNIAFNGALTLAPIASNVSIIGPNEYNPSTGTLVATCNLITSNVLASITDYDPTSIDTRSNVTTHIQTLTVTEVIDAGLTLSNTTTSTLSNVSIDVFDSASPATLPRTTSNIVIYNTSNIFMDYTRQQDTYNERVAFDVSHYFHYAAHDPSYFLHPTDSLLQERPTNEVTTTTTQLLANTSNVRIITSNLIYHSNVSLFEPLFPLTRNILYQNSPDFVYNVASAPAFDVVRSNVGPITQFTQASLDQGHTWLRLLHSCNMPVPFTAATATVSLQLPATPQLQPRTSFQSTIALGNDWQASNLTLWDTPALPAGFLPHTIHIQSIQNGILHDATHYKMSYPYARRDDIYYMATTEHDTTDQISFYYANQDQTAFTDLYTASITLDRTPLDLAQDVNIGLCPATSSNQLRLRTGARTHQIVITSTENATLTKTQFNLDDTIYVTVPDATHPASYFLYDVYDDAPTPNVLLAAQRYDLRPYTYIAFPRTSNIATTLRIEQIGNAAHVSNVLVGDVWTNIASLNTPITGRVSAEDLRITFPTPLQYGFLWNETTQEQVPTTITLADLQTHRIHYVPFTSNDIPNETTTARFIYDHIVSPLYTLDIKNYISRFPRIAIDTTVRAAEARQVSLPSLIPRSQGLIADGLSWSPSTPVLLPQQTTSPLQSSTIQATLSSLPFGSLSFGSQSFAIVPYTHSKPIQWTSLDPVTIAIDQADRWSLRPIVDRVSQQQLEERDIIFYVTDRPEYGIIIDTTTGCNIAQFTDTQLLSDRIIYQHIGAHTSNDTFHLGLSSTPYDLTPDDLVVHITPREMPKVIANKEMFVTHSTVTDALATPHSIGSNIITRGDGYLHVLSTNADIPSVSLLTSLASQQVQFQFRPEYFDAGTSAPFPPIQMRVAVNQTQTAGYVNPLASLHPTYENLFIIPFQANLNRYVNSNVITEPQAAQQVISYNINRALSASSNLAERIVTYFLQIKPVQGVFDTATASATSTATATSFLRTFDFDVEFIAEDTSSLCTLKFTHDTIQVADITVPFTPTWSFNTWHNILFINQDPDNNDYASLYIDYDLTISRIQNASRNVLAGRTLTIPDLGVIEHIYLRTDMQSASNYLGPSQTIIKPPVPTATTPDPLGTVYELQNYRTQLQYRNQEVYITTYSLQETQTGTVSALESLNHNVVIGKEITVRGVNNICVGNRFVTSGRNSIIVGNDIGTGVVEVGTINDVYESIVIGNESFQNSIVRDVICIGNRNLNNLYQSPVERVNDFLSQRPILIGNDITQDRLDFNINIGNAFTKTLIGGPQIYLGLQHEVVGIGYTNNVPLSNEHQLWVNGSIYAEGTITCCNLILTGQLTSVNMTSSNTDKLSIINTGIGPAFQVQQYGANPSVHIYDNQNIALAVATGGNIGIGTLTPAYKMHVMGDVNFTGGLFQNGVPFTSGRTTSNAALLTEGTLPVERLPDAGVAPATYGSSTSIPILTVDAKGRITEATTTAFSLAPSASIDTTNATNITSGTLSSNLLPITGVTPSTYGTATQVPSLQVDATGRILSVTRTTIALTPTHISGLAPSATIDATNANNITTGTINANLLPNAGVTAGTYGSSLLVPRIVIDSKGRITAATNTAITISASAVTGLVASATVDTTNAANITSGTLAVTRLPTTSVVPATYGSATTSPTLTIDATGRITTAASTPIILPTTSITGLAPSATTDTTNASHITTGTLANARLPPNITVTSIAADGSSLSNLNATYLTSGTLPAARLPPAFNVTAISETVTITPTRVGISTTLFVNNDIVSMGTITASNLVVVGDTVLLNTLTSNTEQVVINNAGTGPALKVVQSGPNTVAAFYDAENVDPCLYITDGGYVGIGTTNPTTKFHVIGDATITGTLTASLNASQITTGTLSPNLLPTIATLPATPIAYGSATTSPTLTVDPTGRITSVTDIPIVLPTSSITGLAPSATTDTTNATNLTSGTLSPNLLPTIATLPATPTTYGTATASPTLTIDPTGRITSATDTPIVLPTSSITGLAPSATTDATNATNITTGTLSVDRLAISGVTPTTYGSSNTSPTFTVDLAGRITSATDTPIVLPTTSITGLAPSATTDATNATNITSGTLDEARFPTITTLPATPTTYGSSNTSPTFTVDPTGRLTFASNVPIVLPTTSITGLAPSATTDATNATNISSGTLAQARLPNTTVVAATYGSSNTSPTFTVDPQGRLTFASNTPIVLPTSSITGLAPSATTDTTNATNIASGTLDQARLPTVATLTPAQYGTQSKLPAITVDATGRITAVQEIVIQIASSNLTDLASSATTDTTNATNISSGTLSATRLQDSGVTAAQYGTATASPTLSIDAKGRITAATNTPIVLPTTSITGLAPSATIDATNATNIISGTLNANRLAVSGVTAATYGASNASPTLTIDAKGRITFASNIPIVLPTTSITGLAPSATTDTTNATNITSGTLSAIQLPTTTVVAATYGASNASASFTVDTKGRLTFASNIPIILPTTSITGLAPSATTDTTNATNITSGTLDQARLPTTTVVAATYGASNIIPSFTVDAKGRLSFASNIPIVLPPTSITGLAPSATTDTTNATNITSGTLDANRLAISGVAAATYGTATASPSFTVDTKGRLTFASNIPIILPTTSITGLAPSATTDTTNATNLSSGTLSATLLPTTTVVAATYGTSNTSPSFTVDAKGRLTFASNIPIVISNTSVTGLAPSATTDATNATNITTGTLDQSRLPTTTVVAATYGTSNTSPSFTVDAKGRLTFASNIPIVISNTSVTGLAPSATTDATNATNITTGTLDANRLAVSGVAAGSYGTATTHPTLTIDTKGRITFASNIPIILPTTSITGLAPSATTDATNATNITTGTLDTSRLAVSGVAAGSYGTASNVPTFTVDTKGRVTVASNVAIAIAASAVSGLAPVATTGSYSNLTDVPFSLQTNQLDAYYAKSGNIGIGTTTPNYKLHVEGKIFATSSITAYSDARVKTNIAPIQNPLHLIQQLRGVSYDRIDTGDHEIGLIAQEVAAVLPEVVIDAPNGKSIAYGNMVAVLLEAVKTLTSRVEDLEETIAAYKTKLCLG